MPPSRRNGLFSLFVVAVAGTSLVHLSSHPGALAFCACPDSARSSGLRGQDRGHGNTLCARKSSVGGVAPDEAYRARIESLTTQLSGGGSYFPGFDARHRQGCSFQERPDWEAAVGRHYVLLTSASGEVCLGWAWLQEEREWWTLQQIWVHADHRKAGLAKLIIRYIESATRYPLQTRETPSELRLTALADVLAFYDKVGFKVLGGPVFAKEMSHSEPGFQDVHSASRIWVDEQADPQEARWSPTLRFHVLASSVEV
eukprot:CAMPEP_0177392178 /NCGR_PEP_ID=MMETSP0368-20130122/54225_1 /TAXON_ID=447022 ORGANISM="Scrippsiella hangoei-like, Strain SHHI-4" /NCGR_SAMPLE_ID=MMETSP0368 /ASSEMBLY_ACC=CAM_ASM_000363 /LENGTH=256 /DNA_ID=CAMNT_0018858169 /DNA_START=32 /DNA_END=802 /DNA_ORIENTATION=-